MMIINRYLSIFYGYPQKLGERLLISPDINFPVSSIACRVKFAYIVS